MNCIHCNKKMYALSATHFICGCGTHHYSSENTESRWFNKQEWAKWIEEFDLEMVKDRPSFKEVANGRC